MFLVCPLRPIFERDVYADYVFCGVGATELSTHCARPNRCMELSTGSKIENCGIAMDILPDESVDEVGALVEESLPL